MKNWNELAEEAMNQVVEESLSEAFVGKVDPKYETTAATPEELSKLESALAIKSRECDALLGEYNKLFNAGMEHWGPEASIINGLLSRWSKCQDEKISLIWEIYEAKKSIGKATNSGGIWP